MGCNDLFCDATSQECAAPTAQTASQCHFQLLVYSAGGIFIMACRVCTLE